MLHYFKFRQDLFDPVPAREVYTHGPTSPFAEGPHPKLPKGKGRPEECPPLRAANAFGFDVLANFTVTFKRLRSGGWECENPIVLSSDFDYAPPDSDAPGKPLTQQYAWFWEKGQKVPHVITDNVYDLIQHQVKVSTFLYLKTDPNELLMFTDVPLHARRPWRHMTAVVDTDWYPASYPWHAVLELDPGEKTITIHKGEPICRIVPLRRDTYFAGQMTPDAFDDFFARSQRWLTTHGRPPEDAHHAAEGTLDITRTYTRQQIKSRFIVLD